MSDFRMDITVRTRLPHVNQENLSVWFDNIKIKTSQGIFSIAYGESSFDLNSGLERVDIAYVDCYITVKGGLITDDEGHTDCSVADMFEEKELRGHGAEVEGVEIQFDYYDDEKDCTYVLEDCMVKEFCIMSGDGVDEVNAYGEFPIVAK